MSEVRTQAERDALAKLLERVEKAQVVDGFINDPTLNEAIALALDGYSMWKSKHGYWNLEKDGRNIGEVPGRSPNLKYDPETGQKLGEEQPPSWWGEYIRHLELPNYAGSIDAAVALVEKMLPDGCYEIKRRYRTTRGEVSGFTYLAHVSAGDTCEGATPALALCAALLRALIAQETK